MLCQSTSFTIATLFLAAAITERTAAAGDLLDILDATERNEFPRPELDEGADVLEMLLQE